MAPIVTTPGSQPGMALATVPSQQPGRGTIPLSTLIDYILQRTYHEITILAELLPKKSDMERKIDIVQFASRTRQLFIRLLSLVKWANSAGKVDKCDAISTFLDRQSLYFVDSADMFAKMARETLVHGRLPNFSLPCAIDVLTTGSYPRLPTCIRDRIVPPDLITPAEKHHTLTRLSQIIQHRLVTHPLPAQLHNLSIDNGRVHFHVEHEFRATLTLMGDSNALPWRLLDIEILVEDPELGDGKALVHSLQVHYIHQLVQARLLENERPLHDLYNVLHSFCQSLQLEVLFSQAERLLQDRYGEHVRIDEYIPGRSLVLSYWREKDQKKQFIVQVHVDRADANKPLQVTHIPGLSEQDAARAGQAIKSDHLSVEKLLAQTIQVRSEGKLRSVEAELVPLIHGQSEIRDVPSVLYVPILQPIVPTEMLRVSVDILRGVFLVSIAQYPECPVAKDLDKFLNERRGTNLQNLISELRVWLALRRCEKSAQYLPASVCYTLPFSNLSGHALERLESTRLYLRIGGQSQSPGQSQYFLVVEARRDEEREVRFQYFLLSVTQLADVQPQMVKAGLLMKLDQFTVTHAEGSRIVQESDRPERLASSRKRRLFGGRGGAPGGKQMKFTSQFLPELTHVYSLCEERVPYVLLTSELGKRGFSHQGIRVDGQGACLALTLTKIPDIQAVSESTRSALSRNLLSCTFRLQRKPVRLWLVELVFNSMVIESQNKRECGPLYRAHLQYELPQPDQAEKVVKDFLDDWTAIALLYQLVLDFREELRHSDVSCDVTSYSFKRMMLSYGPERKHTVCVNWKAGLYQLVFAMVGSTDSANCHAAFGVQLTQEFNKHKSITALLRSLEASVVPLTALQRLTSVPTPGLILMDSKMRNTQPLSNFTLVAVTSWHVRLVYRSAYCLDVRCQHQGSQSGSVNVRDGAYSLYDATKVMAGFSPVPSLKAFLEMYAGSDQQQQQQAMMFLRRRSTNDDDNPPSPVMDMCPATETTFMPHQHIGSPAGRRLPPPASPMTPSSNPHTPASPAARIQAFANSPAAAFQQLASPPSIPGQQIAPSPSGILGTPSPGVLQGINSPGTANLHVTSPGFVPTPSPAGLSHLPSPATAFLNPGSQEPPSPFSHARLTGSIGSPHSVPHPSPRQYNIMSPGTPQNPLLKEEFAKPASVSSQYPSRMLPQRAWAASVPTLLSHQSLLKVVSPTTPGGLSPLEQFLGAVYTRRQIQKNIQSEEGLIAVQAQTEPGVIHYKTESLRLRCSLNPQTLLGLQLQATAAPEYQDQWSPDDLKVLEEYFQHKVACYPYKPGAVTAFNHILVCPLRVLRDFIGLMRLELVPDRNLAWTMDLCLTFSPESPLGAPMGSPAIVIRQNRILFMLQLTRTTPSGGDHGNQSPQNFQTLLFPFLYDTTSGQIQVAESKNNNPQQMNICIGVNQILKRFYDFNGSRLQQGECLLSATVKEVLGTLILPQ